MRVLVTGASGFVGGHLAPALVAAGHEAVCVVRDRSTFTPPAGATVVEADLARPFEADAGAVDAIVHLAQANVRFPDAAPELFRVNAGSTVDLLEYARRNGAGHFLLASTASVYGFGERPFVETDSPEPPDFYATTKLAAEQAVLRYGEFFATGIFRLVAPYGPGQTARLIPRLVDRVRAGEPVTLNSGGRPRLNPVYIADVARIFVAALERSDHVLANLGGDEPAGIGELATLIGESLGREPAFEDGSAQAAGDVVADSAHLKALFAPGPLVGLRDGLARTVAAVG
jgi:UDP-glucose 4-epimerase